MAKAVVTINIKTELSEDRAQYLANRIIKQFLATLKDSGTELELTAEDHEWLSGYIIRTFERAGIELIKR